MKVYVRDEFQQHGSSHIHLVTHYSDIQNHTDEENDPLEADASRTTSTQAACNILAWTTPDNEIIYNTVVIAVLLI